MTTTETKGYLTTWSKRTGIAVEVWALPAAELPSEVGTAIRAALDNVERSGGATTVSIAVTTGPNGLRMTISDNGKGTAAIEGVAAMRSAFARIGGTLSVHTVPGEGTTVQAIAYGSRHPTRTSHT